MIVLKRGSLFSSSAEFLTCTVNCVGVMGKGIAKDFKNYYPLAFRKYKMLCDNKKVIPGHPLFFFKSELHPTYPNMIMFPTKDHWMNPSKIEWVENGLDRLLELCHDYQVDSVALPYLGAGCGGLDKNIIHALIKSKVEDSQTIFELWDF